MSNNGIAFFDDHTDKCPECYKPLVDCIIDPVNNRRECGECGAWVHVGDAIGPEPKTWFKLPDNQALAMEIGRFLVENFQEGWTVEISLGFDALILDSGKPVENYKELVQKYG